MKNPPLLFLDIECLGLDVEAPIWDLGAILLNGRNEVHPGKSIDVQILHNPTEGGRDCDNTLKCVVPMQLSRLETCD